MEIKKRQIIIPVFIPHKGCPFDCIFCNQKSISGQTEEMTTQKMEGIIEEHLSTIKAEAYTEIAFYGGSFTGIPFEEQTEYLRCAGKFIEEGRVDSIRLSTRPDYIDQRILDNLKKYGTKCIELGVQSLDEEVLKLSCRGHSVQDVYKASQLIKDNGLVLGIQTMIGLPGDTVEKSLNTAKKVVELAPLIVRIYPAIVIKGTFMEKMYCGGSYSPLSLEEAIELSCSLLDIYDKADIKVIRLGLQATDTINDSGDIVAGPFHPAFRELVESRRLLRRIEQQLDGIIQAAGTEAVREVFIEVPFGYVSKAVGQKKSNIAYLKSKYKLNNIKISENGRLDNSENITIKK